MVNWSLMMHQSTSYRWDFSDWDKVWQSTPIEILCLDVHIWTECHYKDAQWLVILKSGWVLQNFYQGLIINFIEDNPEVKYVVTWKYGRTRTHTLIEVVAYTAGQWVIEPYAVAWSSLVMLVLHINKAFSFPELRQHWHYQALKMFRVKLSSNCTSYIIVEILLLKLSSHTIRYNLLA